MKLPQGQVPMCVNPLGVVVAESGKKRAIIDPLYPNLMLKYEPLRYEQLSDIPCYIQPEDWATTTDEKSGYYHQALHPSMWTLMGFQWRGEYYVYTHMAFGIGPACRTYTILKQEMFRVVREVGNVRMSFLIDDQLNVAGSPEMAAYQAAALLHLQWALGFTLSKDKCQLAPTQQPHFLGMIVDIPRSRFVLPDTKVVGFQKLAADIRASTQITAKALAKAAGKLVSFAPAIGLAPLYCHHLYKIMKGQPKWDTLFPTPKAAMDTILWVASHLEEWNGKSWACSRDILRMAGDYSSIMGYAAFAPGGELDVPMVVSLTDEELEAIASNRLSSTYGELKVVQHMLAVIIAHHPALARGKLLRYEGDNQAAMEVLSRMAGNDANFPLVKDIYEQAKAADIELAFEWHPRHTPNQEEADALSKLVDNTQWALNPGVFNRYIANHPVVVARGGITIDLSADNTNHKAPRFMSKFWCPGTEGVNCLTRPSWAKHPTTGARELCYINGDFSRMGEILAKVMRDKADCIIVYPEWPRYWQALWAQMGPAVKDRFTLPRTHDLCVPGPRVDPRKGRGKPPNYPINVAVVLWD